MSISIFLIIILFMSLIFSQPPTIKYSLAKSLPSGDYFILYHEGINIYNADFSFKDTLYSFSEEKINGESDYKKTKIEEYLEKDCFYILSLVNG